MMLPYEWKEDYVIDAINRIREIFKNFENAKGSKSLTKAGNVVEASSINMKLNLINYLKNLGSLLFLTLRIKHGINPMSLCSIKPKNY